MTSRTAEEGFVLSRLDTELTIAEMTELTGLDFDRVASILAFLEDKGLVECDTPRRPFMETIPEAEYAEEEEGEGEGEGEGEKEEQPPEEKPPEEKPPEEPPPVWPPVIDESSLTGWGTPSVEEALASPEEQQEGGEEEEKEEEEEREEAPSEQEIWQTTSMRKVFEYELRSLPRENRVKMATFAKDSDLLLALCFDPDWAVVRALLTNELTGLQHARLIAEHHRNPQGLEAILQRKEHALDGRVQRMLLRNIQLSEGLAKHILAPKSMIQVYKTSVDTDVTERTRAHARTVLRGKFIGAQGEERAGLIFATEGRVLPALSGLTFCGRTTSLLCGRTYTSHLFVRNLARFSSCPPLLLAHLMKQAIVKRNPQLKMMLLQHPNMPAETKRRET